MEPAASWAGQECDGGDMNDATVCAAALLVVCCSNWLLFCFVLFGLIPCARFEGCFVSCFPVLLCLASARSPTVWFQGGPQVKQQTEFESPSLHALRGEPSESGLGVRVPLGLANADVARAPTSSSEASQSPAVARDQDGSVAHGSAPSAHLGPRDWMTGVCAVQRFRVRRSPELRCNVTFGWICLE